jgi:hypothetical protein
MPLWYQSVLIFYFQQTFFCMNYCLKNIFSRLRLLLRPFVILNLKHFASLTLRCMHCYTCEVIRSISFFSETGKTFPLMNGSRLKVKVKILASMWEQSSVYLYNSEPVNAATRSRFSYILSKFMLYHVTRTTCNSPNLINFLSSHDITSVDSDNKGFCLFLHIDGIFTSMVHCFC